MKASLFMMTAALMLAVLVAGCGEEKKPAGAAGDVPTISVEQKICPIMGLPIDKKLFVEHKGQKVYFCCQECVGKFKADPEKWAAKLGN